MNFEILIFFRKVLIVFIQESAVASLSYFGEKWSLGIILPCHVRTARYLSTCAAHSADLLFVYYLLFLLSSKMRLFAISFLALSEGQKVLSAARHETSKMPFPRELKDNAGICGRIQLRPDQPYGIQRPHKNKNGVPGKNKLIFAFHFLFKID